MKVLFSVLSFVLIFEISLFSQDDDNARDILDKVSQTNQSLNSLKASFSYIMENKEEGIHDEKKGNFLLKGDNYQLILPLMGLEIYKNGPAVWTYLKDANEVSISEFDDEMNEMINPSKIFTIYKEGFSVKFVEEKTSNGVAVYVIDLYPDDEEREYSKMSIEVDKNRMLINKATIKGKEGNIYIVKVDELTMNPPVDDDAFVFDTGKYPGIEIVDLR